MFKAFLPALLLASSASLFATTSTSLSPCAAGTLATYENSYPLAPSSGCSIGILDYSNFSYHALSNAPATSDIILTPSGQGFNFTQATGTPFIATAGETVQFEIDYYILIDPAPIVGGASNKLDPPTGNVTVSEDFCNDSIYLFPGSCYGSKVSPIDNLTVGTPSTPYPLSASITFSDPATSFETVGILFTLNGPASFDGFTADSNVIGIAPEPASLFLVGLFLVAAAGYKRLGYKLRQCTALPRS